MACADIIIACADENFTGSFKTLWVIPFDEVDSFTEATGNDHSYTGVVLDPTGSVFYEVQGIRDTKAYNSEGVDSAGASVVEKNIEMFIPFMDSTKAWALECFKDCRVVAIIETYDSKAFVIGYDSKLTVDAALKFNVSEIMEGTIEGQNGYNITLTGRGAEISREYKGTFLNNQGVTKDFS